MSARSLRLALMMSIAVPVVPVVPVVALSQGFEYATGTSQYRVTQKSTGAQEAMGQKNPFETSATEVMTTMIERAHKDTLAMTVILDSISLMTPMGPAPGIEKFLGLKVKAKLSPAGVKYSSQAPGDDSLPGASQITEGMVTFLPKIPKPLTKGASWTDTTTGQVKMAGLDVDRRVVATYTVTADTTVGAEKGWTLIKESSTSLSGSGASRGGQAMTMEGTSKGKSTFVISQKGVLLGGEGTEDLNMKLTMAANGMEIGVTQATVTKVEKVK